MKLLRISTCVSASTFRPFWTRPFTTRLCVRLMSKMGKSQQKLDWLASKRIRDWLLTTILSMWTVDRKFVAIDASTLHWWVLSIKSMLSERFGIIIVVNYVSAGWHMLIDLNVIWCWILRVGPELVAGISAHMDRVCLYNGASTLQDRCVIV